jgi:hypothetical protein
MINNLKDEIFTLVKLGRALSYYAKIESDTLHPSADKERILRKLLVLSQSVSEINMQLHQIQKTVAIITDDQPMAIPFVEVDAMPQSAIDKLFMCG